MILFIAYPIVVVENGKIEAVYSSIYFEFLIIFQMGIKKKGDIRGNTIGFMYDAFPI